MHLSLTINKKNDFFHVHTSSNKLDDPVDSFHSLVPECHVHFLPFIPQITLPIHPIKPTPKTRIGSGQRINPPPESFNLSPQ